LSFSAVDTSPDMFTFIASFPALRELEMNLVPYWGSQELDDQMPPTPPAHLHAVRLSRCPADVILDWLLPQSPHTVQPYFTLLELGSISDIHIVSIPRSLNACGPFLQRLALSLRLSTQGATNFCCLIQTKYLKHRFSTVGLVAQYQPTLLPHRAGSVL
jgi:hypothetical protein